MSARLDDGGDHFGGLKSCTGRFLVIATAVPRPSMRSCMSPVTAPVLPGRHECDVSPDRDSSVARSVRFARLAHDGGCRSLTGVVTADREPEDGS